MIWFDEEFHLDGQPEDHTVKLTGGYTEHIAAACVQDAEPIVSFKLSVYKVSALTTVTIFSHNPSMMRYEEPSADDILAKYNHKVVKACNLIKSMNYAELLAWAKKKNAS